MQHNKQRTKSHTGRTESGLNEVKYSIRTVYCTIMKWAKNLPIKIRDTCFEVESKIFNAATKTAGEGSGVKKKSRMSSASYYQYCGVSCVFIERLRLHPSAKEKIAAPPAPDPGAASYRHRFNLYSKSPPPSCYLRIRSLTCRKVRIRIRGGFAFLFTILYRGS
jgi:hypothetical protein